MRVLCADCFNQITNIQKDTAVCSHCGKEYYLKEKASKFKIRIEGGFIQENLSYEDVINGIKNHKILADEYIATPKGPWISIYDSPFEVYYKQIVNVDKRDGIILYNMKRRRLSLSVVLGSLLIISIAINFVFMIILTSMSMKINDLIAKITGG